MSTRVGVRVRKWNKIRRAGSGGQNGILEHYVRAFRSEKHNSLRASGLAVNVLMLYVIRGGMARHERVHYTRNIQFGKLICVNLVC